MGSEMCIRDRLSDDVVDKMSRHHTLVNKHVGIDVHAINFCAVMIRCGRDYTSKMRSIIVFKCRSFVTSKLNCDEAKSWLPPMSISESRQWSDDLVGLRSNLVGANGEGERLNQANGMVYHESELKKKDKLVIDGCAADSMLEEEEKVELVFSMC